MKLLIAMLMLGGTAFAATPQDGPDLTGVKCIVNGNAAAKAGKSSDYLDGKVYFCCGNCKAKFDADSKKFAVKANHQLALTGQYVQVACPFGGKFAKDAATNVGGVSVCFCNQEEMKKVKDASDLAAKAEMVFNQKSFSKAFKPMQKIDLTGVQCMLMPAKGVKAKHAVDYKGGQVFFCCKGCAGKFAKNPSKYAEKANQQLVATGQFKQMACPLSGGDMDDDQVVSVSGIEVKFCCGNCVNKVGGQANDAAKSGLVFSDKSFAKGFEKN